jgi:Tfp pilus assembly protein PilO
MFYSLRDIFFPFVYFFILALLYIFLLRTGLANISEQSQAIKTAKKSENVLKEKEALLKSLQPTLPSYVSAASMALPEKNPALAVTSQLKRFAGENALFLEDLKIGGEKPAIEKASLGISFSVTGTLEAIFRFLQQVNTSAPVILLTSAEFSQTGEGATVDLKANFFWAPYPNKISPLESPLVKFTEDDLNTLAKLENLKGFSYTSLTPQSPSERITPFSF